MTPVKDLDQVAVAFLNRIGYLPRGPGPGTSSTELRRSVPYRLFVDCFMENPTRGWFAGELSTELKTTKPTVYRHLKKLKSMDLLEETMVEDKNTRKFKKAYRIRYGDLSKAWHFVEAHFEVAMANYRETVDHFQKLSSERRTKRRGRSRKSSRKKRTSRGKGR